VPLLPPQSALGAGLYRGATASTEPDAEPEPEEDPSAGSAEGSAGTEAAASSSGPAPSPPNAAEGGGAAASSAGPAGSAAGSHPGGVAGGPSQPGLPAGWAAPRSVARLSEARLPFAIPFGQCYTVWRTPGAVEDIIGLHCGAHAWDQIRLRLAGGAYQTGRDRLAGFRSFDAARAAYVREAVHHRAPVLPRVFLW